MRDGEIVKVFRAKDLEKLDIGAQVFCGRTTLRYAQQAHTMTKRMMGVKNIRSTWTYGGREERVHGPVMRDKVRR